MPYSARPLGADENKPRRGNCSNLSGVNQNSLLMGQLIRLFFLQDEPLRRVRMLRNAYSLSGPASRSPRRRQRNPLPGAAALTTLLGLAIGGGFWAGGEMPDLSVLRPIQGLTPATVVVASSESYSWMLDPTPSLGPESLRLSQNAPLGSALRLQTPIRVASAEPSAPPPEAPAVEALPLQAQDAATSAQVVPLPVPRPPELRPAKAVQLARITGPRLPRRIRTAKAQPAPVDNRSFLEKLLGLPPATAPALGYAALDSRPVEVAPNRRISPAPNQQAGAGTAIYDISARTVYLPNGERLEAHSGLGAKMDDPRYVHVRMRGATPPGTYDLSEREKLFHGVRAIRLTPVGGNGLIFGRTGLLAHTYMLGPNGDSNGCVSFRDYDRFLQAYLRGEVNRLVVVAGRGQDRLPSIVNTPVTGDRSARDS